MKLMGHRGARHEFAENTLRSIEIALDAGVESIEIDVHRSKDGRLVVIHDETVDRTTDGTGRVLDKTLAELRSLDAGDGERLPTLDEVLNAIRGRAELFVELKAPACEALVVEAIATQGLTEACWVKSFNHRWIRTVKQLAPTLRAGCLLVGLPADPAGLVGAVGGELLSVSVHYVDAELVRQCHDAGLTVCAWNCNAKADVARFEAMGLDYLGTDVPTTLLGA